MFTQNGHRSFVPFVCTLLVVLGLCASSALAASQTAAVSNGTAFGLNAVFVPGHEGNGAIMASGGDVDDDVVYSIRFDSTGDIRINGAVVGWALLTQSYTVSTNCRETSTGWVADTMIRHTATGIVTASDMGRGIGAGRAATVTAEGAFIAFLTVD